MNNKVIEFIRNYIENKSTYDNGYLYFNPGYFQNQIWFRYNSKINNWQWSNDLIYWNNKCDKKSKSSIWINSLFDSQNDINYILKYLRLNYINKNIIAMYNPLDKLYHYINEIKSITSEYDINNIKLSDTEFNNKPLYLKLNLIDYAINLINDELDKNSNLNIKKINDVLVDKDTINNLNNKIGNLINQNNNHKIDNEIISNYLINYKSNINLNNTILSESILIYQSGLLSELNITPSNCIEENTKLLYSSINSINSKLDTLTKENKEIIDNYDEQVFEKNLLYKKINGLKSDIKSNEKTIHNLQVYIEHITQEKKNMILEIENYKNTIEGNTHKISGLLQELNIKKNTNKLILVNNTINNVLEDNELCDYDILNMDDL